MNIMKTCKSCILIHPHIYSRFKIHNMIYHLEWKCLLFSLFHNLIWKKMKNIVILSGELFVRICVCFDVVIHGYVSGIKKISLFKTVVAVNLIQLWLFSLFVQWKKVKEKQPWKNRTVKHRSQNNFYTN